MNDLKSYIDNQLSDIKASGELTEAILNKTVYGKKSRTNYLTFSVKKLVLTVGMVCLLLAGSVTAFAAAVPAFNDWIYSVNPKLAELLYPVNETAEDQGIKIDVLYAGNDNHNAVVYFTAQDTTGKNRVNENLDLCDTCDIDGPCVFNIEMLSYDEKTKTALFIMRGFGGEEMSNKMTTFQITKIMSNKITHDWYNIGIDIESLIDLDAKSFPVSEFNYTGGSELPEKDLFVLEPDVMSVPLGDGIDFVTISNIGFVDGKLHIQTKWETSLDNHGRLWLTDKNEVTNDDENTIIYDNYYFRTEEDSAHCSGERFAKHIEYVFDIGSLEELSGYNLWGSFVEDGSLIEGEWKVNFRFSDTERLDITQTGGLAEHVEVTSIGAYIKGYRGDYENICFSILKKDGAQVDYSRFGSNDSSYGEKNLWDVNMMFVKPVDLSEIKSVSMDGIEIYRQ